MAWGRKDIINIIGRVPGNLKKSAAEKFSFRFGDVLTDFSMSPSNPKRTGVFIRHCYNRRAVELTDGDRIWIIRRNNETKIRKIGSLRDPEHMDTYLKG